MSRIAIRYFTGDVEERALSKKQPLSIGRNASNDLAIDEDDVGPMHCRISWNGKAYEVVAATPQGVEVNGTLVQRSALSNDDVLRIGTVDITAVIENSEPAAPAVPVVVAAEAEETPSRPKRKKPLPDELFDDDDVSDEDVPVLQQQEPQQPAADDLDDSGAHAEEPAPATGDADESGEKGPSLADRLRKKLEARSVRPGEQPVLQSKFLISIVAVLLVLGLTSGILWFWTQYNAASRLKEQAEEEHTQGKYTQAIDHYSQFLDKFPRNQDTDEVFFKRATARVDQYLNSSSPNWKEGLKAVNEFIRENRERDGYGNQSKLLRSYAEKIALGAAQTAARTKDRSLLPTATDARNLARQFKPTESFEDDFETALRNADIEIGRYEKFQETQKEIADAIDASKIALAIKKRFAFFQFLSKEKMAPPRPEELAKLDALLKKTLEKERSLIALSEPKRPANEQDRPGRLLTPLTFVAHEPEDGRTVTLSQTVLGVVKNCCYGIDRETGQPLWRRPIGQDTPFFPLKVDVKVPALLVYDTNFGELLLLNRRTGKLIWRQTLHEDNQPIEIISGKPLVVNGQIFVPTQGRHLYRIDLATGQLQERLRFSQGLLAPPLLTPDGKRIVILGKEGLAYTVELSPKLKCETVSYVGHRAGSVRVPLMLIGKLILMCENHGVHKCDPDYDAKKEYDKNQSAKKDDAKKDPDEKQDARKEEPGYCRLRVLNTSKNGKWLGELTFPDPDEVRVKGQVLDPPALWGNSLYVPWGGRYVTAFSVNDDTEQPESERTKEQFLRRVGEFREDVSYCGPIHLATEANWQFFLISNELKKLQLTIKSIVRTSQKPIPMKTALQPPQMFSSKIYIGRRAFYSTALHLTETDRDEMKGAWGVFLGARLVAWNYRPGNPILCMSEEGKLFRTQPADLSKGGFQMEVVRSVLLPTGMTEPMRAAALPDGGIAAVARTSLWMFNSLGQLVKPVNLPKPLEADPVVISRGLVLPLADGLYFVRYGSSDRTARKLYSKLVDREQATPKWQQVIALDDSEVVALNSRGELSRFELSGLEAGGKPTAGPKPPRKLTPAPMKGMAVLQGNVAVADSGGSLRILNPATLQPVATAATGGQVTNSVWVANGRIYVEVGGNTLQCYEYTNSLKKLWEYSLKSVAGLAGAPLNAGQSLVIAERDGTLHWIDPMTGKAQKTLVLADPVTASPRNIEGSLVVPVVDGSLYRIPLAPAAGE